MLGKYVIARIISAWALVGGALLLVIVIATAVNTAGFSANMLARTWGGNIAGLSGYEDGVTMLIGVSALAMFPYCQLHGGHAAVDVFMQNAPVWANRFVEILSAVVMALIAIAMAYMLIQGTLEVRSDNTETAVLGWPIWIFMPFAVVSCVLWALAAIFEVIKESGPQDGA